jgi:hypothetical protein
MISLLIILFFLVGASITTIACTVTPSESIPTANHSSTLQPTIPLPSVEEVTIPKKQDEIAINITEAGTGEKHKLSYQWVAPDVLHYQIELQTEAKVYTFGDETPDSVALNSKLDLLFQLTKSLTAGAASFDASFDQPMIEITSSTGHQSITSNDLKVMRFLGSIHPDGSITDTSTELPFINQNNPVNINIEDMMGQFFQVLPRDPVGLNAKWTLTSRSYLGGKTNVQFTDDLERGNTDIVVMLKLDCTLIQLYEVEGHTYAAIEYIGETEIQGASDLGTFDGKGNLKGVYLFCIDLGKLVQNSSAFELETTTQNQAIFQTQKMTATLEEFSTEPLPSLEDQPQ